MKFKKIFILFLSLFVCSSCEKESSVNVQTFLSYRYNLEDCANLHGQDLYEKTWFSEYGGESYKTIFDLSQSYLNFETIIVEEQAKGVGTLHLIRIDDSSESIDINFKYYCSLTDTTGGRIYSNLPSAYHEFVFCIYWVRLNMDFEDPTTHESFILTLHFRGGSKNPYPDVFDK